MVKDGSSSPVEGSRTAAKVVSYGTCLLYHNDFDSPLDLVLVVPQTSKGLAHMPPTSDNHQAKS